MCRVCKPCPLAENQLEVLDTVVSYRFLLVLVTLHTSTWVQWRSQSTAVARAQHGHTTFASSLVSRPRPAFSGLQYGNGEATRGVWGMLPQKILSFLGRFWGYFRPYRCLELEHFDNAFATNLRARSVRSLWYLRQTHIHRDQGSIWTSLF